MAPSFLSKLVKPLNQTRGEATSHSIESQRGRTSSPSRTNAKSTGSDASLSNRTLASINISGSSTGRNSPDSVSTQPSVTVVPPSPGVSAQNMFSSEDRPDQFGRADGLSEGKSRLQTMSFSVGSKGPTFSEDDMPTPTPRSTMTFDSKSSSTTANSLSVNGSHSRSLSPSSSTGNLRAFVQNFTGSTSPTVPTLNLATKEIKSHPSKTSLTKTEPIAISHPRSVTTQASRQSEEENGEKSASIFTTPLVESPTALRLAHSLSSSPPNMGTELPNTPTSPSSGFLTPRTAIDSDAASIRSVATSANGGIATENGKKKSRPWRRGSNTKRKPTGLASAIAASGLAMAQPTMSVPQFNPTNASAPSRKSTIPHSAPPTTTTPGHTRRSSNDRSPRSTRENRSPSGSHAQRHPRRGSTNVSISAHSEGASEIYGDVGDYSGVEENSDDEDDEESEDDLLDLDLGEDDIPVTGFAVASNKRNADFHDLFPTIPEGDYLIEDYGCAMQREILIQGRLYISENHICFHANIFGWITDLSVPIYEIISLEKKMTAFVIPNAIQIATRQSKYTFASFLSRDTTFDVIFNIWRLARPEESLGSASPRGSVEASRSAMDEIREGGEGVGVPPNGVVVGPMKKTTPAKRKVTQCACGREGKHFSETALETILPGTPDRIHNLIFASGFIKDFMRVDQKLLDIQISDWTPVSSGAKLLARNMSYIKPLSGSLGPKQTKCEIRDETIHADFDDYSVTLTTTRTPDVPSGSVFSVKTRTCIMWASNISTKVIITTQLEWTGRSFIKGIIEKSAIEGQKVYHADLDKAMRKYIQDHQSEFIPEGTDLAEVVPEPEALDADLATSDKLLAHTPIAEKERERERNLRGLQWAYDTFAGAYGVAKQSTNGALELIRDAWDQSTSTTILYFVIVLLVLSNLWTLMMVGSREEAGRRKEMRKMEEREKWIQGVVTALWDSGKAGPLGSTSTPGVSIEPEIPLMPPNVRPVPPTTNWRAEIHGLETTLDAVEKRVHVIRDSLTTLNSLN